jgi:hypothetical protein
MKGRGEELKKIVLVRNSVDIELGMPKFMTRR